MTMMVITIMMIKRNQNLPKQLNPPEKSSSHHQNLTVMMKTIKKTILMSGKRSNKIREVEKGDKNNKIINKRLSGRIIMKIIIIIKILLPITIKIHDRIHDQITSLED